MGRTKNEFFNELYGWYEARDILQQRGYTVLEKQWPSLSATKGKGKYRIFPHIADMLKIRQWEIVASYNTNRDEVWILLCSIHGTPRYQDWLVVYGDNRPPEIWRREIKSNDKDGGSI